MIVTLDTNEIAEVESHLAESDRLAATQINTIPNQPIDEQRAAHRSGWLAELALAKIAGVVWRPRYDADEPDVGFADVRSTKYPDGYLRLTFKDKGERPFVLMVGADECWRVAGWIKCDDGRRAEFFDKVARYWKVKQWALGSPGDAIRVTRHGSPL